MEAQLGALGFATPDYYPPQATVSLAETTFMPSPEPSVRGETEEKKPSKKRKSWGQELPIPKTNLPPRKRAKTEDEKEQRRIERVLRNRQAAQSSRERKRQEVEKLEGEKYSIEDQNKRLKERLMTVEHEKFQLAQEVAKLSAQMSRYRNGGSLAPVSTATSCAPSPSLHPDMFQNIKQELDDYPFALPTPQHSIHLGSSLTPPSTCSIYSRSPSPFHGGLNVCTSSSDMTQHPAAMLCGLQCQSEAARAASIPPTSRDEIQRQRQLRLLYVTLTQTYWTTLISAVYSHLLHPLQQIFTSLRTGSPIPIKTTPQAEMISLLILWLISTPANLMTTPPTPSNTTSHNTLQPTAFRIRLLRRLLLCSPALARPLKEAAAGGVSRLKASYALNRMSKVTDGDILVSNNGDAVSLGQRPEREESNGSVIKSGDDETSSIGNNNDVQLEICWFDSDELAIMGGGSLSPAGPDPVSLLILGAGWTSTFLLPLLKDIGITYAATTRNGHDGTIPYTFDPSSDSLDSYHTLPSASTVLVTFPLKGHGQSKKLLKLYREVHGSRNDWIQLGSTGIWKGEAWMDLRSPYDVDNERAMAEDELRSLGGCVLNLAGLYGGERQPRNWITRVATSKEQVKGKGALHLVHGHDVAQAIIATHRAFGRARDKVEGKRYMLTDLHVYDWWDLIQMWGKEAREKARSMRIEEEGLDYERWVGELMIEEDIKALPRDGERLGRRLDGRAFWQHMGIWPEMGRVR